MALPTINNQREDSSLGVTTRKFKTTRSGLNIPPVIDNQRKANLWMWPQRNLRPHGVAWTYHLSFITRGRANLWMWPQKFKNTRGGFPGYEIGASCILFQYVTWSGTRLAHLAYYFNFHLSFGDILRKSQGPHTPYVTPTVEEVLYWRKWAFCEYGLHFSTDIQADSRNVFRVIPSHLYSCLQLICSFPTICPVEVGYYIIYFPHLSW